MTERVLLEDIVTKIGNGIDAEQIDQPSDGMLPISRIETIWDGVIDFERVKYAQVAKAEIDKYALQSGDILFSHINSPTHIGKTAIYRSDQTLIHGINLLLIRVDQKKCYPEYLNYYFKSKNVRALFRARCKKAVNQASLNQPDILELEVPLPPLSEQKRIASLLARADRLRSLRRTAHELGESLLQSVFLEMFGDVKSNPKKWDVEVIGEFIRPTKQMNPKVLGRSDFWYVDITSIDRQSKTIVEPKLLKIEDAPSRARKHISANDILVSTVHPNLNAVAKVPYRLDNQIASTGFCVLRPDTKKLTSEYLFAIVQSKYFVDHLVKNETGANYPAVSDGIILDTPIPVPPLSLQEEFAAIVLGRSALGRSGAPPVLEDASRSARTASVESLRGRMGEAERQAEALFQSLLAQSFA